MNARLTKLIQGCKAPVFLLMLPLGLTNAADLHQTGAAGELRDCIAQARGTAAVAGCEKQAQLSLKKRNEHLSAAIRARLNRSQLVIFERSATAWQTFFEQETGMLDLSLAQRTDGLGASLRPGAVTRLYEQREQQLREHLHNLSRKKTRPRYNP